MACSLFIYSSSSLSSASLALSNIACSSSVYLVVWNIVAPTFARSSNVSLPWWRLLTVTIGTFFCHAVDVYWFYFIFLPTRWWCLYFACLSDVFNPFSLISVTFISVANPEFRINFNVCISITFVQVCHCKLYSGMIVIENIQNILNLILRNTCNL